MPSYTVETSAGYDLEDGVYPATVQKIEEEDMKFGPALKFFFDLGGEVILTGLCNSPERLNPKTKVYKWGCAILGVKELAEGETLDTDDLVTRHCRVQVINRDRDGQTWATVADVLPARVNPVKAGRPVIQPQRTVIVQDDDEESVLD